jgi:hypothetical protein
MHKIVVGLLYIAFLILGLLLGWHIPTLFYANREKLPGHQVETFKWEGVLATVPPDQRSAFHEASRKRWDYSLPRDERNAASEFVESYEAPYRKKENDFVKSVAMSFDDQRQIVEQYSREISQKEVHNLSDRFPPFCEKIPEFLERTGNKHPDFYYPVVNDSELGMSCSQYALFIMRGENPQTFIDPHATGETLGVFLAQGYRPVPIEDADENDVVFYFSYNPKARKATEEELDEVRQRMSLYQAGYELVHSSHYGVVRKGKVVSKDLFGCIAHHSFDAGATPGKRYMIFRKPFNPNRPIPNFHGISDWYETDICVTREVYAYPAEVPHSKVSRIVCALTMSLLASVLAFAINTKLL